MTGPTGKPAVDAWIAGFLAGIDRKSWEDMHDWAAVSAIEWARSANALRYQFEGDTPHDASGSK